MPFLSWGDALCDLFDLPSEQLPWPACGLSLPATSYSVREKKCVSTKCVFCYIQAEALSLVSQAERFSISAWPLSGGLGPVPWRPGISRCAFCQHSLPRAPPSRLSEVGRRGCR